MHLSADETPVLAYAIKPRRRWRWYVSAFVLTMLVGAGIYWRTTIISRMTHLYWQRRVATFEYPEGTVVLEAFCSTKSDAPAGWASVVDLLKSPNYEALSAWWLGSRFTDPSHDGAGLKIPEIAKYNSTLANSQSLYGQPWNAGLLFIGMRSSRAGTQRIVLVSPYLSYSGSNLVFECRVVKPAGIFRPEEITTEVEVFLSSKTIQFSVPANGGFRAFGGQRDPADASRFTIDYETATEKGTIVAVLQDDASVVFSILKR